MKASEANCRAMPCAASSIVPIVPISSEATVKRLTSARIVSEIGMPRDTTSQNAVQSGRQNRTNSSYWLSSGLLLM
ncbi:hypothetical protein D9M72_568480 [compost metagenome]